jgi:Phosphodiester glycosidase
VSEADRHERKAPQVPQRRLSTGPRVVALAGLVALAACGSSGGSAAIPVGPTSPPVVTVAPTLRPAPSSTSPRKAPPPTVPSAPVAISPRIRPALAGEGVWVAADSWRRGPAPLLTTSFRPDPSQPGVTAYVAWMRTSSTQLGLYPGYEGPGPTSLDRGPEMVPTSGRGRLLATFNSGFYERDAPAGFYAHGTAYFPMKKGLATVVAYTDGQVDVVDWRGGPVPSADVVLARQNLTLLVDGGAATPLANDGASWGLTLHGVPTVWRTGLGIDAEGNLIYVAAPDQTASSLAAILVAAGAVRAMELDINPEWPIFATYRGPGAARPVLFVPNPNQIPNRFLYPSTKDFFALYGRLPGERPPW